MTYFAHYFFLSFFCKRNSFEKRPAIYISGPFDVEGLRVLSVGNFTEKAAKIMNILYNMNNY